MIEPREAFRFPVPVALGNDRFRVEWIIPSDLAYFEGHFPGNPVLPAVALLDGSVELARLVNGAERLELSGTRSAKFSVPLNPNDRVQIVLTRDSDQNFRTEWNLDTGPAAVLLFSVR